MSTAKADFDGFYQAHFGDTVAMTFSYTADLAEAQDIAQEAFSRAWQRWAAVSRYDNPLSWVRRVATNLAHSRWRRVKVATAYLIRQRTEDLPELSPDSVDVVNALKRLPVAQRKAIVLYYLMDLPIEEVAEELGAPAGTVKSWLHRGRASLSADLGDEVRRTISPSPPEQLRDRADKQKRNRRTITTATSIVTAIALILAAVGLRDSLPQPQPPATPSPSTTVNPAPDGLPYNCVGQPLPIPEGFTESTIVSGADPTARFLTGKVKKGNETRLVIWVDGELNAAFEMSGSSVDLHDVNSKGKAVGTSATSNGDGPYTTTAWVYDGRLTALPGTNNTAYAINETGTIVGSAQDKPAVWRPGKTTPEFLSMPAGERYGFARDITEDGIIVGVIGESHTNTNVNTGNTRSVAWYPDGSRRDLTGPDATQKFTRITSAAGDWAVGSIAGAGAAMTGIRWNLRTGQTEAIEADGYRTNAQGWTARGNSIRSRSASVTITPGQEGIYANGLQITAMSDDGRILAGEIFGTNTSLLGSAVTWRCAVDR